MTTSDRELRQELERLRAENAALAERQPPAPHLRVSERGGVSLYGIRRFPITFYFEEWQAILARAEEIRAFLSDHEAELKKKPPRRSG